MIVGAGDKFTFSEFKVDGSEVTLHYRCGDHGFSEIISFPFPIDSSNQKIINAIKLLHLISGVSYYKAFVNDVKEMAVAYSINKEVADFLNKVYENGLGEFYYQNGLEPYLKARFDSNDVSVPKIDDGYLAGYLVGFGGGKDSLVTVELLKQITDQKITAFGVNASSYLDTQTSIAGIKNFGVERTVDTDSLKKLKTDSGQPVPNGHIPISAILMSIGLIIAIQNNVHALVSGVEQSANEPTLKDYQGKDINHQYSKSISFEKIFNKVIKTWVGSKIQFFSLVRPLTEFDIMKIFINLGLDNKYKNSYSSCNKSLSFTSKDGEPTWCGECQKCAFIFLLMAGVGAYDSAMGIFGRDLIADPQHEETYQQLLGLTNRKPFECVGEINESRVAMQNAKKYSEAAKKFNFPEPTEIEKWSDNNLLPKDIYQKLREVALKLTA